MSINENKEFEAINQKVSERTAAERAVCCSTEEIHRVKKVKAKRKAIALTVVTLVALGVAMLGITGLELIGWINTTFHVVLQCVAGCVAMFKAGYLWHEIKN